MKNEKTRIRPALAALAVISVTLLGGCTQTDSASVELFLTDLLRSAAAALLL